MKTTHGGKRPNAGRKKRTGDEPVRNTTIQVEGSVIDDCRQIHGTLANALRYAAKKEYPSLETAYPSSFRPS